MIALCVANGSFAQSGSDSDGEVAGVPWRTAPGENVAELSDSEDEDGPLRRVGNVPEEWFALNVSTGRCIVFTCAL